MTISVMGSSTISDRGDLIYFGTRLGSPPGVPGGGITGVMPPPTGGTEMPGSTPAGGQITPFERDSSSLKLVLAVVSPAVGGGNPPLLRWQSAVGEGENNGGVGRSGCADAVVIAAVMVPATVQAAR